MKNSLLTKTHLVSAFAAGIVFNSCNISTPAENEANKTANIQNTPNVIFILIDDQRYDFLSFLDHPWIKTPNIDKLAENSVFFKNAFVTNSLCSPSRASILTGMYSHAHGVIDNDTPLNHEHPTFPKEMQKVGYNTALVGKWHMGGTNAIPRPGFDLWISFEGQGPFYDPTFNINGEWVERTGYTPDLLTEYAISFIEDNVAKNKPYCLYLSHKSVHEPFTPAKRHEGAYKDLTIPRPSTFENNTENTKGKPEWVVKQRQSWHGSERENLIGFDQFYRNYGECMLGVDESVGEITKTLEKLGQLENTLIVYFSDNGYFMGEHGLIDKRLMYEESMRVPMFIHYPDLIKTPALREEFVLNIDIAPTILDILNIKVPETMHGKSMLPLLVNKETEWRTDFLYEYFNDLNAVQTPSILGVRNQKYSYITNHGVWDNWELYDMENDPEQKNNLLQNIKYGHNYGHFVTQINRQDKKLFNIVKPLDDRLNEILNETGGRRYPIWKKD